MPTAEPVVEELTLDECWDLVRGTGLGRLATSARDDIDIVPLNYFVHDGSILFRSAPGSKLTNIAGNPRVAFEVDGIDSRWHWSVVIHGDARELTSEGDIVESGVGELISWSPTRKETYVRVTPRDVSGRRIDRHAFPRTSMWG